MANENNIALGVMQIAASNATDTCTFKRAYKEIPNYVRLTANNLSPSLVRKGEVMWQQLVRNIKSHDKSPGNYIYEGFLTHVPKVGYRITPRGKRHLKSKGL